jgi:hypothetical protein
VRGCKDRPDTESCEKLNGRVDAVAQTRQPDIHHREVRLLRFRYPDRLFSRGGSPHNLEAAGAEMMFCFHGDKVVILDQQDPERPNRFHRLIRGERAASLTRPMRNAEH